MKKLYQYMTFVFIVGLTVSPLVSFAGGPGGSVDAPLVNAGPDQTIMVPANRVMLSGSSTGISGLVLYYTWTKLSGSGDIGSPYTASTDITNLTVGTSTFRLTVTNNTGSTAYDDVSIFVNSIISTSCAINSFTATPSTVAVSGSTTISWSTSGCATVDIMGVTSLGDAWDRGIGTDVNNTVVYGPPSWMFIYGNTGVYSFTLRASDGNGGNDSRTILVNVQSAGGGGGGGSGGGSGGSSGGGSSSGGGGGAIPCPFGVISLPANCVLINIPLIGVKKTSGILVIKDLQKFLNWNLGSRITPLVIDGKWGTKTDNAIRLYQSLNTLKADAKFGKLSAGKAITLLKNAKLFK